MAAILKRSWTSAKSHVRIELHLTEAGDRAGGAGMRCIDLTGPQMLVHFAVCLTGFCCRTSLFGAGDGGSSAIQAWCASILLFQSACEEVQGVLVVCFLQSYWGEERGCVPAGVCCCMEAGSSRSVLLFGVVTWRGAVCLLCDLWNVPPCLSLKFGVALTGPPKNPVQLELIKASQWT